MNVEVFIKLGKKKKPIKHILAFLGKMRKFENGAFIGYYEVVIFLSCDNDIL